VLVGYPFAFIVSKMHLRLRGMLIFLVIVPFWTNSLIRLYSIITIIRVKGWLNHLLLSIGLIHQPLDLLYTQTAVFIGLVYVLLPFMIVPLYANMEKFDWRIVDAARDLGANRIQLFLKIILPLTMPGIGAGVMLVFLPAVTMFYIPDVLGGAKSLLIGNLIKSEFIEAHHWPLGSAVSVLLTILMIIMIAVYWRCTTAKQRRVLL
jgi:spermidine/putrescine transport system permease protein